MRLSFEWDEMPDYCFECPCFEYQYGVCCILCEVVHKRPSYCPLRIEEPVKHGKWIPDGDTGYDICSVCKQHGIAEDMNYCQNCGEKLDLEE